jgi:hypothetical protein
MFVFFFSSVLILFPHSSMQYLCSKYLQSTIDLVENSSIEFGCLMDSSVKDWLFTRKEGNTSLNCKFTTEHPNQPADDCELGERLSFVGKLQEYKFRLRINPLLEKGLGKKLFGK